MNTENRDAAGSFAAGMRLGVGPAAPTFVLGIVYGAAASGAGWGFGEPLVFSALAFSGSAQFTLLTALSTGSALAAVGAAVLINARYVVMSAVLNDSLRGGRLRRSVLAQALTDASFALAHHGGGRFDITRLVGASVPQWSAWVSGTAIGLVAAPPPVLLRTVGLDVAFPAFFLVLAVHELHRSRRAKAAAAGGAGIAAVLLPLTDPGIALLGATAAALIGALPGSDPEEESG
ncbi:AzlC family ABC transporter permease [Saccharopolyspora mangrovi]|uniref:AzlC family ABC transporter permease n=1 Tax=Saccharopolyspora mangrovi TaxID=3082379 RepID=A0ABU6ADQ9_9PSEU|nr:AzlC family ABC transporter permease [Saccharopolyspora sp. S2-29]MEB3369682.1 AzlC family ABC transporter permease [Saccharopolyspora sp. S2-29]